MLEPRICAKAHVARTGDYLRFRTFGVENHMEMKHEMDTVRVSGFSVSEFDPRITPQGPPLISSSSLYIPGIAKANQVKQKR